jgi:hypothetical protein
MERRTDKPVELTAHQLDIVTGGRLGTGPTHLPPRNPFGPPKPPAR